MEEGDPQRKIMYVAMNIQTLKNIKEDSESDSKEERDYMTMKIYLKIGKVLFLIKLLLFLSYFSISSIYKKYGLEVFVKSLFVITYLLNKRNFIKNNIKFVLLQIT